MNASNTPMKLPGAAAAKKSLLEWQEILARYPLGSRWGLGFQAATTLSANGTMAWLVATGRMTPFELVLLVAIEAVLLIGMAWAQQLTIPLEAREKNAMPLRERLGTAVFGLVWLGGVYGLVLFAMVPSGADIGRALKDPLAFLAASSLKWPLLITFAGACVDALQDRAHFSKHGGKFFSTPGLHGAARLLTLFLGGIPFFVPLVGVVVAIKLVGERVVAAVQRRSGKPSERTMIVFLLSIPLIGWFGLYGLEWLVDAAKPALNEAGWWALCYASAKFVADLFIVCLPLIASKAYAEELEAASKPARAGRKSRLPG